MKTTIGILLALLLCACGSIPQVETPSQKAVEAQEQLDNYLASNKGKLHLYNDRVAVRIVERDGAVYIG